MLNRFLAALALVCALASAAFAVDSDGTKPDNAVTPGAVRTVDREAICGHSTKEVRHTTQAQKNSVFGLYGLASKRAGWCSGEAPCSVDHRVPLECGGADVTENLWPEKGAGAYNQEDKNRLENLCHKLVCTGQITPQEGQAWFLGDWTKEFDRRFGAIKGE